MRLIKYILCIPFSLVVSLLDYLILPILPVNSSLGDVMWGNWGNIMWNNSTVQMNRYDKIVLYLWRNRWLSNFLKADIDPKEPVKVYGDIKKSGWLLTTGGGYFNLLYTCSIRNRCIYGEFGWRLQDKGGKYVFTPIGLTTAFV